MPLAFQTAPGLTHRTPNQRGPDPGLCSRADGNHRRNGRGLRAERAEEPGMGAIEQKRSRPDARQNARAEQEQARQRQARGGKHRACVARRNGQRKAGGAQCDIGQTDKKHAGCGNGDPGCRCDIAAGCLIHKTLFLFKDDLTAFLKKIIWKMASRVNRIFAVRIFSNCLVQRNCLTLPVVFFMIPKIAKRRPKNEKNRDNCSIFLDFIMYLCICTPR